MYHSQSAEQTESFSEYAISQFKNSFNENFVDILEGSDFPHWNEIIQKIQDVWSKRFSALLKISQHQNEIDNCFSKFTAEILRIFSKKEEYTHNRKYFDYVIDYQINRIRSSEAHALDSQFNQKENSNDHQQQQHHSSSSSKNHQITTEKAIKTMSDLNINLPKMSLINPKKLLKQMNQFEMSHLIRAHSKENNINDSGVPVTDAAFEIFFNEHRLGETPRFTSICATCGHNVINFIDVDSGKIIKRFNDDLIVNGNRDVISKLAWTSINECSVLVAGGLFGQIKVILPKHSTCLTRIDAHKSSISALLFHYKHADILLSASDNCEIKIWKLKLKEASSAMECECPYELIGVIAWESSSAKSEEKEAVLSLCFVPNDYLIISTTKDNYYVHLDEAKLLGERASGRHVNMMSIDEEVSNEEAVDFMTSKPDRHANQNLFKAELLLTEGSSDDQITHKDRFVSSETVYFNNFILANLVNTNLIYVMQLCYDEPTQKLLKTRVVNSIPIGGKSDLTMRDMKIKIYKENGVVYILKASTEGLFYHVVMEPTFERFITIFKYKLPANYSIKKVMDPYKTKFENYGLLPLAKTIQTAYNGSQLLVTTDQNIVSIWQKIDQTGC